MMPNAIIWVVKMYFCELFNKNDKIVIYLYFNYAFNIIFLGLNCVEIIKHVG